MKQDCSKIYYLLHFGAEGIYERRNMKRLIIKNASELVTCSGRSPKHGKDMSDIGMIRNGAVVVEDGIIAEVGTTDEILSKYDNYEYTVINAEGKAVLPGL